MIYSEDFVKNVTTSNNIANLVLHSFDELILLYNIIGQRENIRISVNNNITPVSFDIRFENKDYAIMTMNNINNKLFMVYETPYLIKMTRNMNVVHTQIMKQ